MKKKNSKLSYLVVPLIAVVTLTMGNYATNLGLSGWYQILKLPDFTPDGLFIGIIWAVIYILTTISVLIYINKVGEKDERYNAVLGLFGINALLNILWSFIFFAWHSLDWAVYEMIILEITNAMLVVYIWKRSKLASILLWPYLIWVGFATYLAIQILILNS